MANLTITAASVVPSGNAVTKSGTAGATITAGQAIYLDPTSSTYKLADCDLAGAQACDGIALNGASAGQPVDMLAAGDLTIGATLTKGTVYVLAATAGMICPLADLVTTDALIQLGIAKSTTLMGVRILNPGVTL